MDEGNVPVEKVSGIMPSNWVLSAQVWCYLGDKIQNVILVKNIFTSSVKLQVILICNFVESFLC